MVNEPNIEDELEDNEEGEQGESDSNMQALLQEVREFAPTMTATSWLDIPRVFMDPPLIPTSTDLARVVDKRELLTTSATVLTLFARGGTCMPEHFNKMLSFLSLLNRNVHNLTGFVAQTPRTTLNMAPRGKVQVPTGVLLKTTGTPAVLVQHEANFVQTDAPILTADAMAAAQLQEAPVYSLQELCTVEWGIIPFRYKTVDEEEVRDVFQVRRGGQIHFSVSFK